METTGGRGAIEEGLFGQPGTNNEVAKTRVLKSEASGWTANTSAYISKLNSTQQVGPNQLLKVMAGDLLSTNAQYYYNQTTTNSATSTVFSSVISMLTAAITNSPASAASIKTPGTPAAITANLNTGTPFSQVISTDITSASGTNPKAYLNIVFFDERFNFVAESSTSARVGAAGASTLGFTNIKAPKNGYCFVYVTNESSVNVFFDNLQVRHDRGRILEENHYYAYGLKIPGISSKAYGAANNNFLYQGDYSEFDDDLGWNDFELRSYDPQIGRFLQNDPYDQFASGYVGMGNDPVNNVDPSGGVIIPTLLGSTTGVDAVCVASRVAKTATSTMSAVNLTVKSITLSVDAWHLYSTIDGATQFRSSKNLGKWYDDPETGQTFGRSDAFASASGNDAAVNGYDPNFFERWRGSKNLIAQAGYETLDGLYIFQQSFFSFSKGNEQHLGGGNVNGQEKLEAGAGVAMTVMPIPAVKVARLGKLLPKQLGNFIKSNFRKNLIKLTKVNPGKTFQAHHVFPQKFEAMFESKGLNIHDPNYGSWWETVDHQAQAYDYNAAWEAFLASDPKMTEILDFGKRVMAQFGQSVNY